jgi:nucleoside-diphosphate-sugar epimerase
MRGIKRIEPGERVTHQELVIGLGPLGRRVVKELQRRGQAPIGASRHPAEGFESQWRRLDASDGQQVREATADCDTVYLCAAPPLTRWMQDFEPLVDGVLGGLQGSDKTLVFASNLYAYGDQQGTLTESTPELAAGPKGKLRRRLDEKVLNAPGLRTAVVRGASFYGPGVESSMAGRVELEAMVNGKPVNALGCVNQPHSMTFIDDFARAMVNVGRAESGPGGLWHAPMQDPITHRGLMEAFGEALGATPKFRIARPAVMNIMSLFNPTMKALKETYYTYSRPHLADDSKYCEAFDDRPTPLIEAVRTTVDSTGLLAAK